MRVRYTRQAHSDLDTIYSYLNQLTPAAAQAVKSFIERRISRLADYPFIAPATDEPGVYELMIVRYPYKAYYEIVGDDVWVLHIRDSRRQP